MTMNLSLQLGRALFAVGFAAIGAACAFAQSDALRDADADAPTVAHKRLEIATLREPKADTHFVVTSVSVGMPEDAKPASAPAATTEQQVALRTALAGDGQG
jgi:hypothetical protein